MGNTHCTIGCGSRGGFGCNYFVLANDAAVRSVYLDEGGVFSSVEPGAVILEMSTISPELSRACIGRLAQKVSIFSMWPSLDRHRRSRRGRSRCSAGGDPNIFEQCTPLFESIARQWFLIGPGSSGVQMKLVVNLLLGLDMQAIAEAVSLGEHLQIDRECSARCPFQDRGSRSRDGGEVPEDQGRQTTRRNSRCV